MLSPGLVDALAGGLAKPRACTSGSVVARLGLIGGFPTFGVPFKGVYQGLYGFI